MIPAITHTSATQKLYQRFIKDLTRLGFAGELCLDYANRIVLATDNSIYQVLPQGIIYPRHTEDLLQLTRLSRQPEYRSVVLSPRGGGTGTNGQSLSDGLVVDTSRYMNNILAINVAERWARVQCGVVKEQLNAALEEYGLFFAPELSTSNRATIGGMISTDASGQGSCVYGKTRDHVLELLTVLMDGNLLHSRPLDEDEVAVAKRRSDLGGAVYRRAEAIDRDYREEIKATFPVLNRCLTGYDLAHLRTDDGRLDLNSLLCGSEGTLGFIVEAKVNLLEKPRKTALLNLHYDNFDAALRDAAAIMQTGGPSSIETIDSLVLGLARQDSVWREVAQFFPDSGAQSPSGVNFVEYTADSETALREKMSPLLEQLEAGKAPGKRAGDSSGNDNSDPIATLARGYTLARDKEVAAIWAMRKKAVGLLGNIPGEAQPTAFVEDTCVPPEHLADYCADFRRLLDAHQLQYGMFGHVDAGVLHVRPMLDMKRVEDERLVRIISDQVVALTQRYNGLLWGEHGKGMRSEYSPRVFGSLYPLLQQIKAAFDPYHQLNTGKIATPGDSIPLLTIDGVPTRGQRDRVIDGESRQQYPETMLCNGNGACHNWDPRDAMCPSWKATRKRIHSPKGRASLMREWLAQLNEHGGGAAQQVQRLQSASPRQKLLSIPAKAMNSLRKARGGYDFSHEVHESMAGCLACKSCTGSCPVKVDVPELRSRFLELYYSRYLRPLKDYLLGSLENTLPVMARFPRFYNRVTDNTVCRILMSRIIGLRDMPRLSPISLEKALRTRGIETASTQSLAALTPEEKQRSVILVVDAFTRFFETRLLLDVLDLLRQLQFTPWLAPYLPSGKPLHVQGFRQAFAKTARGTSETLNALALTGIPLVGIEPSMTLIYRGEYRKVQGVEAPKVLLIQEWLARQQLAAPPDSGEKKSYKLLAHCTEATNATASVKSWQTLFARLGHQLDVIPVSCCGMAGAFGHETANRDTAEAIYRLSWAEPVNNPDYDGLLVASGFSCRQQVARFGGKTLPHPLQVLLV